MHRALENYAPFKNQLLVCYWSLVEMSPQATDYPVTMQVASPIMSWGLSGPLSHMVVQAQQQSQIMRVAYLG